ncbi:hypothetical protein Vretimale_15922 [Volvox reticuliferus]|nr:hypothetical protein Vretimale_15922 [Volvox reticuliferus]
MPPSGKEPTPLQPSAVSPHHQAPQQQLDDTSLPPPQQGSEREAEKQLQKQQQQQLHETSHNHHKQMQHLHRLLTKQGQDHRMQPTDNHHHHVQRRRSTEAQLGSPPLLATATSSSPNGSAAPSAAASSSSGAVVAAMAPAEDAAAAAAAAATGDMAGGPMVVTKSPVMMARAPVSVFPATAVAVGAVRLLALPRKALLRLPQLQSVLAALAAGQLRILEHRRRDAQEMCDRLEAAAAATGEADCVSCPTGTALSPSASPAKDPYADARRRQSERRAAVGALNGNVAAALRAPEVLPTDEMISRPSAALEKMGFKVPKLRGALAHSTSVSVGVITRRRSPGSRRCSEHQPALQQLDTPFHYSQPNSPISAAAAARMRSSTGEFGPIDALTSRSQSVTAPTGPKLPAMARVTPSMAAGGAVVSDVECDGVSSPLPRGAAATAATASNGGGYPLGLDSPDRLRSSISMPERSGYSLTSRLSTTLPRITKGQVQSLRGSTSGSARGERSLCGLGGGVAQPSDPRSCSGSPIRRSPRVYDMDAYVTSASGSRAGSATRSSRNRVGFEVPLDGDGVVLSYKLQSAVAGVELIASAGSPRNLSLSGAASGGANNGSTAPTLVAAAAVPPPQVAAAVAPPRAVSVNNLGRLCIPSAGLDDGTIARNRRTGSGALSPVSTFPATLPVPPPAPSAATGWRPIRISYDDGRLPVLPSPQRPSRMFQEEAAAAAAALLRGHTGAGAAAGPGVPLVPTPPARPSGKAVLTDDAVVSRWMEEHASGFVSGASGASLLRRTTQGQSGSQQMLPPPSVLQTLAVAAAGTGSTESQLAAAAALKRRSGTG